MGMSVKQMFCSHEWSKNCIRCSKCGKERNIEHDWTKNCEFCSLCGTTRENMHDWSMNCCSCSICGSSRERAHDWDGSSCRLCKIRNLSSDGKSIAYELGKGTVTADKENGISRLSDDFFDYLARKPVDFSLFAVWKCVLSEDDLPALYSHKGSISFVGLRQDFINVTLVNGLVVNAYGLVGRAVGRYGSYIFTGRWSIPRYRREMSLECDMDEQPTRPIVCESPEASDVHDVTTVIGKRVSSEGTKRIFIIAFPKEIKSQEVSMLKIGEITFI